MSYGSPRKTEVWLTVEPERYVNGYNKGDIRGIKVTTMHQTKPNTNKGILVKVVVEADDEVWDPQAELQVKIEADKSAPVTAVVKPYHRGKLGVGSP